MAILKHTEKKPDPERIYECIETYHSADGLMYAQGLRLRGGHPAVLVHPERWIEDGAPADEITQARVALYGDAPELERPEVSPMRTAAPVDDEDAVVCVKVTGQVGLREKVARADGMATSAVVGDRLPANHPLVKAAPACFRPVTQGPDGKSAARERAVIWCGPAPVTLASADGGEVTVFPNQWVDRDHPIVQANAHVALAWRWPAPRLNPKAA